MSSGAYDRRLEHVDELAIAAGEPRSPTLELSYPHLRPSLEPKRLRREEIWTVAEEARRQLCRGPRPKVDIAQIARRTSFLQVNSLAFEVSWELDRSVEDEAGRARSDLAGGCHDLDRQRLHRRARRSRPQYGGARAGACDLRRAYLDLEDAEHVGRREPTVPLTETSERDAAAEIDWVEWRANEFMGAFLAPRAMLHRHMHKRAAGLAIPLIEGGHRGELPVVCPQAPQSLIDELVGELADLFGLSEPFIRMRLRRYGLVPVQLLG